MDKLESQKSICISPEEIMGELEGGSKLEYPAGFSKWIPPHTRSPFIQAPPVISDYSRNVDFKYEC